MSENRKNRFVTVVKTALVVGLMGLLWGVIYAEWSSALISSLIRGEPCEILILGLDEVENTHRADTIALVRIDPHYPAIKILQIPRDTLVLSGKKQQKINSVIARLSPNERIRLLASLLPWKSRPDHYLILRYQTFLNLIHTIGTIRLNNQSLTPENALGELRYRDENGDLGRLQNQQSLLSAMTVSLIKNPWVLTKILLKTIRQPSFLETDLSPLEILSLTIRLRSLIHPAHLYFFEFPSTIDQQGRLHGSPEGLKRLENFWIDSGRSSDKRSRQMPLEILNGSDEPGLALTMTRVVRREFPDFDVLYFGNSSTPSSSSRLILRRGDLRLAKQTLVSLNKRTGLTLHQVISPNNERGVDMTLILGQNAKDAPVLKNKTPWRTF